MRFFEQQRQARAQTLKLLLLFVLTLVTLVAAVNGALALTWWLVSWKGAAYPVYFFHINTVMTLLFVLGGWWIESSNLGGGGGGEKLARWVGAREARVLGPLSRPGAQNAEQRFCNIVSELSIAASMKPPMPMVLDRVDGINAFASGWDEDDAVVAVTQGALDYLTRDELQGLVAHELSHIREGDMQLNMQLAGMVSGLEMIFNLGQSMCGVNKNGSSTLLALPGFAIKSVGSMGWFAGRVLKAAIARQREYLADARAVQFTRSKDGLGGVLRKALGQQGDDGTYAGSGVRPMHPSVQHMLLVGSALGAHWFHTHPPITERIRRIYGRPMAALASSEVHAPKADAIF